MDIYITDQETGERLRFPMLPEKISVQTGATFQSYDIMAVGEVKFPAGEQLTGFAWDGILPGRNHEKAPYVREWKNPHSIQSLWSSYRVKRKKLGLLVTGTPINHNVYLDSYSVDYQGGYYKDGCGDYHYKISFIMAKNLIISMEPPGAWSGNTGTPRTEPPAPKTYTVKLGDTLWGIAEKSLGSGARYPEIHAANMPPLGVDPDKIYVGQVLSIDV